MTTRSLRRPYPQTWGRWPAAILLFAFVWVELAEPFGSIPGHLGILIVVYTLIQIAGMQTFGRRAWIENGEAFAVYFGLIARMAPLTRDREGRVVTQALPLGTRTDPARPGLLAVIMVALGSTTFDGISRSSLWITATAGLSGVVRTAASLRGLLAVIGLVTLAYVIAMRAASRVVGMNWHTLAVRFAHSLVPIVLAYVVAHYFSFLVLEGQLGTRPPVGSVRGRLEPVRDRRLGDQPLAALPDCDLVRAGRGDRAWPRRLVSWWRTTARSRCSIARQPCAHSTRCSP